MSRKKQNSKQEKPQYIKPQIVASYTKDELKEEFKEIRGQEAGSAFIDLYGSYRTPDLEKRVKV